MYIVIVGAGKVGNALIEQLSQEDHDIVVIDRNMEVLEEVLETYDVMAVPGSGASLSVQREAGVEAADLLIAVTNGDEVNLLCCIVGKKLGAKHTIARIRNPEYDEQIYFLKEELGLSMTINPEKAAAKEMYRLLQFPTLLKRDSFSSGRVEIVELKIKGDSVFKDKKLSELYKICKIKVLICAVEREDDVYIPSGEFMLLEGDKIYVTAETKTLTDLLEFMGLIPHKVKNVTLIGGGRIAYYLAKELIQAHINVRIIEKNPARCLTLAEILPKALIINNDGSRHDVLLSQGIRDADASVTLTDMDEENLIISMYAAHLGVKKTITKVTRAEYKYIMNQVGVESVISPKLLTAAVILRYVRAMQNSGEGSVLTLHKIVDKVEALEFPVTAATCYLMIPFHSLPLKDSILVACISRQGRFIIPAGDDYLQEKDRVVIVTKSDHLIKDLNDIFLKEI